MTEWQEYEIMHGEIRTAAIRRNGSCSIYNEKMMPYSLYLESDADDIDTRIQNLDNFYHWCASRVLTLDRKYAKEILNSIGAMQAATDKDRAQIALSYHCLALTDIYWVKESREEEKFSTLNLFDNHLESAFVDVVLKGKQMTIQNSTLIADDLSTQGLYPKAWIRREEGFILMKGGDSKAVERELLASKISRCFRMNQVLYEESWYDGQKVSVSKMITSLKNSIVPMEHFEIYAVNHDLDRLDYILKLDGYSYYMMNIVDYLTGNTDRHWGNWGLFIDNDTNEPVRLHDLMDFNRAFQAYDTLEGANCLTAARGQSQMAAAVEAVKKAGLNQIREVKPEWFQDEDTKEMFFKRLRVLKKAEEESI